MTSPCEVPRREAMLTEITTCFLRACRQLSVYRYTSLLQCTSQCINTDLCYYVTYNTALEVCKLFALGFTNYDLTDGTQVFSLESVATKV